MREEDRYLKKRGKKWHYVRRVPTRVRHLDGRDAIRVSLLTNSEVFTQGDETLWFTRIRCDRLTT